MHLTPVMFEPANLNALAVPPAGFHRPPPGATGDRGRRSAIHARRAAPDLPRPRPVARLGPACAIATLFLLGLAWPLARPADAQEERDLLERLRETRVDMSFDDAEFSTVVEHLRTAAGINLLIDPHAHEQIEGYRVRLHLTKVRAIHALEWLLLGRELAWRVVDGAVLITTRDAAAGLSELRLYDVADIVRQPRDFPPEGEAEAQSVSPDDLVDLIKNTIHPGIWDTPPNALVASDTNLIATAPPAVLAHMERMLAALRVLSHFTLTFDARVIDFTADAFAGAPSAASLAGGIALLSPAEAAGILARRGDSVRVIEAARFTCMNGQRTHVSLIHSNGAPVGAITRDPAAAGSVEVEVQQRATLLEVSPILVVGRDRVLVDLRAALADPPQDPESVELARGRVDCPRQSERRVRTSVQVPNGGACLFVLGPVEDRLRALFLRVQSAAPPLSTSTALQAESADDSQAAAAYRAGLARRYSGTFSDTPLPEAIQALAAFGGINAVLDPQLLDEGIADTRVTLKLADLPLESALALVTRMFDLSSVFRNEALFLARSHRVEDPRIEVYDVRDLLWRRLDWPARVPDWGADLSAAALTPDADAESVTSADALVDLIRQNIAANTWDEWADRVSIRLWQGAMVVTQMPSVHAQLRKFLEQMRAAKPRQVQVDARVLAVEPETLDGLDAGSDGPLPAASRAILEQALAEGRARVDAAWSVIGMNSQRFHAAHWTQRHWISGYETAEPPKPKLRSLVGGWLLDVRPTLVSSAPGSLLVELRAACSDATDPFAQEKVGLVAVQMPRTSRAQVSTTVAVRSGETRLFALGNAEGGNWRRALVWSVREVE